MLKFVIWALVALIFALQVGDWLTTRRIVAQGGREGNPLMVWLIARLGFDAAFALKGVALIALDAWYAVHAVGVQALAANALVCAIYLYIVWHNWRLIR